MVQVVIFQDDEVDEVDKVELGLAKLSMGPASLGIGCQP